jgi:hypothetical protein
VRARAFTLAVATALLCAGIAQARTIHITGTAYEFNNTKVLLGGATIRVAENPRLHATVRRDGSYDLAVPDRATVTPYISASGYHTIYLQTFRTAGADLQRVNFQTPTEGVYRALAALLNVPLDANGQLRDCAIVSTFSTRNVRDLTFQQFTAYGAHGVAGATAFATPALAPPVYFNSQVIPDPSQKSSSIDGGVVWTRVPAGVYTIRASAPGTRFASFVASCLPGRVVNANPPWGLHELGKTMPARVAARWSLSGTDLELKSLHVSRLPARASARLRCMGAGCPFKQRRLGALRPFPVTFHGGQTLELLIGAHAYDGKLVRWRLRPGHVPRPVTHCVPLGTTGEQARC